VEKQWLIKLADADVAVLADFLEVLALYYYIILYYIYIHKELRVPRKPAVWYCDLELNRAAEKKPGMRVLLTWLFCCFLGTLSSLCMYI
jgi:hypothetical protein